MSFNIRLNYKPADCNLQPCMLAEFDENSLNERMLLKVIKFLNGLTKDDFTENYSELSNKFEQTNVDFIKTAVEFNSKKNFYNTLYRLQYVSESKLIEWKLSSITNIRSILFGFENEKYSPEEISNAFEPFIDLTIVYYPQFSYLGPVHKIENSKENSNILSSREFKNWPFFFHAELSTSVDSRKDDNSPLKPNCIFKGDKKFPASIRVYMKQDEDERLMENFNRYLPPGTISFKPDVNQSGVFLNFLKSVNSASFDPAKQNQSLLYINTSNIKGYNEVSKRFELLSSRVVENYDYFNTYSKTDYDTFNKLAFSTGSDIEYNRFKPNFNNILENCTNFSLDQVEKDMYTQYSNQYIFQDVEAFICNNVEKDSDNLIFEQNMKVQMATKHYEKCTTIQKFVHDRLLNDTVKQISKQSNYLICCCINYIKLDKLDKKTKNVCPPLINFELLSMSYTGTTPYL